MKIAFQSRNKILTNAYAINISKIFVTNEDLIYLYGVKVPFLSKKSWRH